MVSLFQFGDAGPAKTLLVRCSRLQIYKIVYIAVAGKDRYLLRTS